MIARTELIVGLDIDQYQGLPLFQVRAERCFRVGDVLCCDLVFCCPKCGRENVHTGFYGRASVADGHRVAHCGCWPDGYYICECQ